MNNNGRDLRNITAERDPEACAQARDDLRFFRAAKVRVAKSLARVEGRASFVYDGCASMAEFGTRDGHSPRETQGLVNLGYALAARPELEAKVLDGDIPTENASTLGRILRHPEWIRPGDEWEADAERDKPKVFWKKARKREREVAEGVPNLNKLTVFLTDKAKDDLDRCSTLASRKAGRKLGIDDTIAAVADDYLERHDPLLKERPDRKVGPTSEKPNSRYIPAAVKHDVRQRSGDHCEFPHCEHDTFLEFAHVKPHAWRGDREVDSLLHLCHRHHVLYDRGIVKWVDGPIEDPVFESASGERVRRRARERDPPRRGPADQGRTRPGRRGASRCSTTAVPQPCPRTKQRSTAVRSRCWRFLHREHPRQP